MKTRGSNRISLLRTGRSSAARYRKWAGVVVAAAGLGVVIGACDPFDGAFDGEFNAGGADPYNFPPAYRGVGQIRQQPASGDIIETQAYAGGKAIGYFSFPFGPGQVATAKYSAPSAADWPSGAVDPLLVDGPGTDFRSAGNPAPVGLVYNFDPPGGNQPFSPKQKCKAPDNYSYDVRLDAFRQDEQWNIFTALPDRFASFPFGALPTWTYRPIVAEVSVATANLDCQSVKSEHTLLNENNSQVRFPLAPPVAGGARYGQPTTGRFLAWAIVDPGAGVLRVGTTRDVLQGGTNGVYHSGTTVQKYGWYEQFIIQYIDGGYIPVEPGAVVTVPGVVDGGAAQVPTPTTRMIAQRLYYPRSAVIPADATLPTGPGGLGKGYDVVQANRFLNNGAGYSPVCEVYSYRLADPTAAADLPKSEADVSARAVPGSIVKASAIPRSEQAPNTVVPDYVFCLQAAPLP